MELYCRKCGSIDVVEKHNVPFHKVGIYCGDCDAWIKWGSIKNSQVMPEGLHIVKIAKAEEINTIFIFLKLENEEGHSVKFQTWKNKETKKYDPNILNEILKGFNKQARDFSSLNELLTYLEGKAVKIEVKHSQIKGKLQAQIKKWICINS